MTNPIEALLETIAATPGCRVYPRSHMPIIEERHALPHDVRAFYDTCGGCSLFEERDHSVEFSRPEDFARSNVEILGEEHPEDISDAWYVVARIAAREAISIDCDRARLGRCYDSFWDRHGVAGSTKIVALSFAELLARLFADGGTRLYWADTATEYGDAYGSFPMGFARCGTKLVAP